MINYKLFNPKDTKEIMYEILEKKQDKYEFKKDNGYPKNIALIFGRIIPDDGSKDNKDKYLQLVIKEFGSFTSKTNFIKLIEQRNKLIIDSLKNSGYAITPYIAHCQWRLVIGLGASHPQETSMTLHHIYGIPYIPGSAVKGITRHWFIMKEFYSLDLKDIEQIECFIKILEDADVDNENITKRDTNLSKDDFKKKFKVKNIIPDDKLYDLLKNQHGKIFDFQNVFGTQKKQGKVIFMDAYPVGEINLKIDIMNPHYQDYYSENKPPADWQNPNPIKFLTIEKTKFQFYLISRKPTLLDKAEEILKESLKEYGIGAKTSLGYGLFEES